VFEKNEKFLKGQVALKNISLFEAPIVVNNFFQKWSIANESTEVSCQTVVQPRLLLGRRQSVTSSVTSFFEPVLQTTASPHWISGQVLSIHSIVSSSRTIRPCRLRGGRWSGHWRTTWSTVCSSVLRSQAAEEARPHLYKQERKRPTPVRRWLSRTCVSHWHLLWHWKFDIKHQYKF